VIVAGAHAQRRADWLAVRLTDGRAEVRAGPLAHVLHGVALAVLDVPLALGAARNTEREMRALLGEPRRHSVFTAPIAAALAVEDFGQANEVSKAVGAPGVSIQMFSLFPHIREAQAHNGCDLREAHAELSFYEAHGRRPMSHPRNTREGLSERRAVLDALGIDVPEYIDAVEAAILAWTARRAAEGTAISLGTPPAWR